jgi:hypothetical protein
MNDADLSFLLLGIATSLERQQQGASAGVLRQAARRLAVQNSDACEHCGEALVRQPTGRPARFCSGRCRVAAWRNERVKLSA